jgi:ABC-type uncharacterized transport system substrate-binding protein
MLRVFLKVRSPLPCPCSRLRKPKAELIINLKTAKALDLLIPLPLLGRADEVIE